MYKVILLKYEQILLSKELDDYNKTFTYIEALIKQLKANKKIIVYERKDNKWLKFGEWKLG